MIRTLVAATVCGAILFVSGGCQSGPRCHKPPVSESTPAVTTPITDQVNLPMPEVAEALYRIAKEAGLDVNASWLDGFRSSSSSGSGVGMFGAHQEQPKPTSQRKPSGIDATLQASSNTGSRVQAFVRTMPDGQVIVQWHADISGDTYVRDFWRARFQAWLKNPKATTKASH